MKNIKTKFYTSIFLMVMYIFMLLLGYIILYLSYFSSIFNTDTMTTFTHIMLIFFAGLLPTGNFIFLAHRAFSVIEISEKGIKKSLFRIFCKREILWDDIYEMRLYSRVSLWLFVSKVSLEKLSYETMLKRKDVIQIEYSKKLIDAIRLYWNKDIIGLSDENKL